MTCDVEGCERPHLARGKCKSHYGKLMRGTLGRTAVVRFWEKVEKTDDGCWTWTASTAGHMGHGAFSVGGRAGGSVYAHRFSWELHFGPIPAGLFVCHRCDNPPCVRPDHLFLGTAADNNHDAAAKGRKAVVNRKLTPEDVATIRALHATGVTRLELARQFGVSGSGITRVVSRRTYAYDA